MAEVVRTESGIDIIPTEAGGVIIGALVMWLFRLHFAQIDPDLFLNGFCGEEQRKQFSELLGTPREEIDQVVDYLRDMFTEWLNKTQKNEPPKQRNT